jgi:hypothetical protein
MGVGWLHALKSNFSRWAWIEHQCDLIHTSGHIGITHQAGDTVIRKHGDRRGNWYDSQGFAIVNGKMQYAVAG